MLDNSSSEETKRKVQAIARGIHRRNILSELERTGYRDPG